MHCIFCKIIKNEIPSYKIIESEGALAILDAFPKTPGHALVLPKRHIENIYDIDEKMNLLNKRYFLFIMKYISTWVKETHRVQLLKSNPFKA